MRLLTTLTLFAICLTATGQTYPPKKDSWFRSDTLFAYETKIDRIQNAPNSYSYENIDNEIKYTDSTGKSIIIQNSLPRGGSGFADFSRTYFGYRVFWTRVINESSTSITLTIKFPADSIPVNEFNSYVKVFLPPDTMTQDKERFTGYGLIGVNFIYDAVRYKPTMMEKTINPKEAYAFYVVVLRHNTAGGIPRSGVVLNEKKLFYKISPELGSELIPSGQIVFQN